MTAQQSRHQRDFRDLRSPRSRGADGLTGHGAVAAFRSSSDTPWAHHLAFLRARFSAERSATFEQTEEEPRITRRRTLQLAASGLAPRSGRRRSRKHGRPRWLYRRSRRRGGGHYPRMSPKLTEIWGADHRRKKGAPGESGIRRDRALGADGTRCFSRATPVTNQSSIEALVRSRAALPRSRWSCASGRLVRRLLAAQISRTPGAREVARSNPDDRTLPGLRDLAEPCRELLRARPISRYLSVRGAARQSRT